jgi:catechol 2,3-dioxygenase-like lactoylglutathione lyase family enzyme
VASVLGIHHVSAIARDPQRNLDFYAGMLGLRLVKRTVNFDDPRSYHLYYGDGTGAPGSLMTFFPSPGARTGRQGPGQAAVVSFAVIPGAIGFWIERLLRHGVAYEGPARRGPRGAEGEQVIAFRDHDGLMVELVAHADAEARPGWGGAAGIPPEHAIRGVHGVTLWVEGFDATERVLVDTLGFRAVREDGNVRRYAAGGGGPAAQVDVRAVGGFMRGLGGAGTVHHVAWHVRDDAAELAAREAVERAGLTPTPVIDRKYFNSVYFREPGGVLFELATSGPGFAIDEPVHALGEALMLPPWYEPRRAEIEAALPRLDLSATGSPAAAAAAPSNASGDGSVRRSATPKPELSR